MSEEQVLVVDKDVIDCAFGVNPDGPSKGMRVDVSTIIAPATLVNLTETLQDNRANVMERIGARFAPRSEVEDDPSVVQLIPYVVFTCGRGPSGEISSILSYARSKKSGEGRLKGKLSLGVGGHVNPCDKQSDYYNVYQQAVLREIVEELGVDINMLNIAPDTSITDIRGYIRDTSNAVNSVHVGVLHIVELTSRPLYLTFAECMGDAGFVSLQSAVSRYSEYETWSQLVLSPIQSNPLKNWMV